MARWRCARWPRLDSRCYATAPRARPGVQLKLAVEDVLDTLPAACCRSLHSQKCSALFEHVHDSYPERNYGVYVMPAMLLPLGPPGMRWRRVRLLYSWRSWSAQSQLTGAVPASWMNPRPVRASRRIPSPASLQVFKPSTRKALNSPSLVWMAVFSALIRLKTRWKISWLIRMSFSRAPSQ